jgi:hypothetical protein
MGLYEKIQKWFVSQTTDDDKSKIALYRKAGQVGSRATFYRFVSGQDVVPSADKFMDWIENMGFRVLFPGEKTEPADKKSEVNEICGRIFQSLNSMGVSHDIIVAAQKAVFTTDASQHAANGDRCRGQRAVGE